MKTIVKMKFGSHLYGLNTPSSDTDIKGIYIPEYRDIILQRVPKTSISTTTGLDDSKNTNEDIDTEMFTLQGFIKMCAQGQTCAVDMLFCPKDMIVESSPEWDYIIENRDKLLTGKASSFVGYCKQQANKYGIKGSRIAALERAVATLAKHPDKKFYEVYDEVKAELEKAEHVVFGELPVKKGSDQTVKGIEVCGRKFGVSVATNYIHEVLDRILKNYGNRAIEARKNENIDWKALSHALRVCIQAEELLTTGKVTFPFTGAIAEYLMDVKLGNADFTALSEDLDERIELIKKLEKTNNLPDKIDQRFWDDFIFKCYNRRLYR